MVPRVKPVAFSISGMLTPSNDFRMNILNATRNSSRLWLFLDISCIITLVYVIFVRFVGEKNAILVKHL